MDVVVVVVFAASEGSVGQWPSLAGGLGFGPGELDWLRLGKAFDGFFGVFESLAGFFLKSSRFGFL